LFAKESASDGVHNHLDNKIETITTAVNNYQVANEKDHKLLFDKINTLKKDTAENKVNLAYIRGKIDIVLKNN